MDKQRPKQGKGPEGKMSADKLEFEVIVETWFGTTTQYLVKGTDRIHDLKRKIKCRDEIPLYNQRLYLYGGETLEDYKSFNHYKITQFMTLFMEFKDGFEIFFQLPWIINPAAAQNQDYYRLEVEGSYRIKKIKAMIQHHLLIPESLSFSDDQINLYYEEGLLDNERTVSDYNIRSEGQVKVKVHVQGSLIINFRYLDQNFAVNMDPFYKIEKILEFLKFYVPFDNGKEISILHENQVLDPEEKFVIYPIKGTSRLVIEVEKLKSFFPITILKKEGDILANLYFGPHSKVVDIKESLYKFCKVPVPLISLFYKSENLKDNAQLLDYNINKKCSMTLLYNLHLPKLKVASISEEEFVFVFNPKETIMFLKAKIELRTKIKKERQILIFDKQNLENNLSVNDCKVKVDSTVYMIPETDYPIIIHSILREKATIYIEPSFSVKMLKRGVLFYFGVQPDNQKLIYFGKELEDGKSVEECKIAKGETIHLFFTKSILKSILL